MSNSLWPHGLQSARPLCPWDCLGSEYWSELQFPSPGDFPNAGFESSSPALGGGFFTPEPPGKLIPHVKKASEVTQFRSVTQSCPTLCDPMNPSTPGLPVHHQLPEFTQTHACRVGDAIQPSRPLSSPSPPAPKSLPASGSFPMSQLVA